jgi:hypothetical protein
MDRRAVLTLTLAAPALIGAPALLRAATPPLEVARSPSCGCCGAWVDRMRAAGFDTRIAEMDDDALQALKLRSGLHPEVWSCHTASIAGYVIEGHVPAADIRRLIAEQPAALGLAVPGMPVGSPGMEMGGRVDPYAVLLLGFDGSAAVFAAHG